MNTREAAERLGINPKALRRHLRDHWAATSSGGQYDLSEEDVLTLRGELKPRAEVLDDDGLPHLDADPGVDVETMLKARRDPHARAELLVRRRVRQTKLRDRLLELSLWGTTHAPMD